MRPSIVSVPVALLFTLTVPSLVLAQRPVESTVEGSGTAVLKKQPETLRLQMDLIAKGKDLKDVLSRLKDRRTAATQQLTALGAVPKSIEFGDPRITSTKTDRQRQMEMMVAQRLRGRGKKAATKKEATPVAVACSLKAEWPLKSKDAEELLVTHQSLMDKLKEADLAGLKEIAELTAEEQEALEEDESMMMSMMSGEEGQKPGEPALFFVSKISDQERAKAMADAFQSAQSQATQLAKSAGAELGPLHHLSGGNQFGADDEDYSDTASMYSRYAYRMMQQSASRQGDEPSEAVGLHPGAVKFRVSVSASFVLKNSK